MPSNLQTAYQFFVSQGDSASASAGIASGLYAESQLNPSNVNPTSGAFGIGQWLGQRLIALEDMFGSNPTFQQQLQFVQDELTGQVNDQGVTTSQSNAILSAKTPASGLSAFISDFERPKAGPETTGDISRGTAVLGQLNMGSGTVAIGSNATGLSSFETGVNTLVTNPGGFLSTLVGGLGSGGINIGSIALNGAQSSAQMAGVGMNAVTGNLGGTVAAAGASTAQTVAGAVAGAVNPLTSWLQGLTNTSTVTRVTIGVVAVILLGAGIFFLAGNRSPTINIGNMAKLKGAIA